MSENRSPQPPQEVNYAALLEGSALSNDAISRSVEVAESIQTVRFVFHSWLDIDNRGINKIRGDINKYPELPRLSLIPLYAWPVAVIKPKPGPARFSLGVSATAGFFQSTPGSITGQRMKPAVESEAFLLDTYDHFGIVALDSIRTQTDQGKVEAALLFAAIMRTARPDIRVSETEVIPGCIRGDEIVMEQLAQFMALDAPKNLDYAIANGVDYEVDPLIPGLPSGHYPISPSLRSKGMRMIEEMLVSVNKAVDRAINDSNGVLIVTRGELKQAEAGKVDAKMRLDPQDERLVREFPGFSMDTAVERAQRANAQLVQALERTGGGQRGGDETSLLRLALEGNNLLMARLEKLEELIRTQAVAQTPAAPAEPGASTVAQPATTEPITPVETKPTAGAPGRGNKPPKTGTEG